MSVVTYNKETDTLCIRKNKKRKGALQLKQEIGVLLEYTLLSKLALLYSVEIYNVSNRLKNQSKFRGVLSTYSRNFPGVSYKKILEVVKYAP